MLGGTFTEELKKNKVLSNKSNRLSKLYFNEFNGKKVVTLYGTTFLNYGYISIECVNAEILKFYYKDILISCLTGSKQTIIPIAIENNSQLIIEGVCGELKVSVYGAKFYNEKCNYIIPMKNYKVEDCGKFVIKKFNTKNDYLNKTFDKVLAIDNFYSAQVLNMSDHINFAYLSNNNGVCLYVDGDNYTQRTVVSGAVKDATIMPGSMSEIYIIYINHSELYYKRVGENFEVFNEVKIDKKSNLTPISFCPIEVYGFGANIFAVKWNDGSISIYQLIDDVFKNIFTFKGDKVKLQLFDKELNIVKINDYFVGVNKYLLSLDGVTLKDVDNYEFKLNTSDYYFIDNSKLYFNNECYTEL